MERIDTKPGFLSFLAFSFLLGPAGYFHMLDNHLILQLRKFRLKSAEVIRSNLKLKQNTS